jgi:lysophospholipase L1-like esterase
MKKDTYLFLSVVLNVILLGYVFLNRHSTGTEVVAVPQRTNTSEKILFIGNSIIAKCNWNELLDNPHIVNDGVGGITSSEIFMRLNEFLTMTPKKIFFEMGINDIKSNAGLQQIINSYYNTLKSIRIRYPFTKVYFFSVLPVVELHAADGIRLNEKIDQLNSNMQIFCQRYKAQYIEINSLLKNTAGELSVEYSLDGTHLSPAGYQAIKDKINLYVND